MHSTIINPINNESFKNNIYPQKQVLGGAIELETNFSLMGKDETELYQQPLTEIDSTPGNTSGALDRTRLTNVQPDEPSGEAELAAIRKRKAELGGVLH
jgi:hypothetical protein